MRVLAAVLVVGARQQHAGELAVRAGARLQRDVRQPGDLGQRLLEVPHQLQRALGALRVLQRVQPRVARAARRRARAAAGCASSCTSRAGRSPSRGRSCASTAGCSGARSRARRPRAAAAARRGAARRAAARRAAARARRAPARRTRGAPAALLEDRRRALALHRRSRLRRSAARRLRLALEPGSACRRLSLSALTPCTALSLGRDGGAEHARRAGRCPRAMRCSVIATSSPSSS